MIDSFKASRINEPAFDEIIIAGLASEVPAFAERIDADLACPPRLKHVRRLADQRDWGAADGTEHARLWFASEEAHDSTPNKFSSSFEAKNGYSIHSRLLLGWMRSVGVDAPAGHFLLHTSAPKIESKQNPRAARKAVWR